MRKRILILDDDEAVLDILEVLLDDEGYEPVMIAQTDDLFKLTRFHQPALILLDYGLSGINGGEWCLRLKSEPEFASIPVIIYTAYSNKGLKKGSFGCDGFIEKPFDITDLTSCVKLLLAPHTTNTLPNLAQTFER